MNPESKPKFIAIGVVAAIIVIGALYWYLSARSRGIVLAPTTRTTAPAASTPITGGLGSDIYGQVSNPIGGKVPAPVSPAPNPIQNAYKNPFQ